MFCWCSPAWYKEEIYHENNKKCTAKGRYDLFDLYSAVRRDLYGYLTLFSDINIDGIAGVVVAVFVILAGFGEIGRASCRERV